MHFHGFTHANALLIERDLNEMEVTSLFNKWLVSGGEQKVFGLYFS